MKFSIKDFFSKCVQIRKKLRTVDLVTFTEEFLNGKFHFLCSVKSYLRIPFTIINSKWRMNNLMRVAKRAV